MSQPITLSEINPDGDRFPSLAAFRIAHNELLKKYREQGNEPEVLHEIVLLICKGKATGVLLDNEDDRWAGQGLLDYWASMLYRAGQEPPEATLDKFNAAYAPHLDHMPCPYEDFEQFQTRVVNLSANDLKEAIEKPAELVGLKFEEGVVDALIQDTLYEPESLSLLQFILLSLWEKRDRHKITWESYQQLGRGRQALTQTADQLMQELNAEEQEALKQIMLNLAQFGHGPNLVKRRITRLALYDALGISEETLPLRVNPFAIAPPEFNQTPQSIHSSNIATKSTASEPLLEFEQILQMLTSDSPEHYESNLPEVQDRFQTLLTQRFNQEIEHKPPLFPWETELRNYPAEAQTSLKFAAPSFWSAQLAHLQLPVPMSGNLLEQLLEHCQTVAVSLQEGLKLVQTVELFFPGQSDSLQGLAGMVLAAPARSGRTMTERIKATSTLKHYDEANLGQKMALSLLAAHEIFKSLTIRLSPQQPVIERRWDTAIGTLILRIGRKNNQLLVEGKLPCGGTLTLRSDEISSATAQRHDAGYLSVSLLDPVIEQAYLLEIQLDTSGDPSITFTIQLTS